MPNVRPSKDATIRVVDMTSASTQIGLRTRHPRTPEAGRYQVAGTLDFRGARKPLAFPASLVVAPDEGALGASLTTRQAEPGMIDPARKTADDVPVRVSMRHRRVATSTNLLRCWPHRAPMVGDPLA